MRKRRPLLLAAVALLATAAALAGASPASAAPPATSSAIRATTRAVSALTCVSVPVARRTAVGCHGATGTVPRHASGTARPAATGVHPEATSVSDVCAEKPGWWFARMEACHDFLLVTVFLAGDIPAGQLVQNVDYFVDTDGIDPGYHVTVSVSPDLEETWGEGLDAQYQVTGWCAGACVPVNLESVEPVFWDIPTTNDFDYDGAVDSLNSVVRTGAEIDFRVFTPDVASPLYEDIWRDKLRCDNVNAYTGCVFTDGDAIMDYSTYNYPNVNAHIATAQGDGLPGAPGGRALHRTTDETTINQNRNTVCPAKVPRPAGTDCDEYPFASTREGGVGATRAFVPSSENRSAGAVLKAALYDKQHVLDGDPFYVNVTPGAYFAPGQGGTGGGGGGGGGQAGEPDLNSDGVADLLSQYNTGDLYAYPGSGGISDTVTSSTFGGDTDIGSWAGHTEYAIGDLNGDGRPDLLSQSANGDMWAYPGSGNINGSTTFWSGTMIGNWAGHTRFALADLDGDGHPDLLTHYNGGPLYVYRGSGHIATTNTFWSGTNIGSWVGHDILALGDLNGDGHPDLLTQYNGGDLYVYPGSGHVNTTTTFWSGTDIGSWAGHVNIDLADLNGDGHPDLLSQTAAGTYYAYPGSGHVNTTTTFWSGTELDTVDVLNYALGDLNGDHKADLLTQTPDGHLHAYPGSGHITATQTSNSTLRAGTDIGNWSGHSDMARGDLNGDGIDDLLTQTANGDVYVYPGSGSINGTTTFWSGTKIGNWAGHTNLTLGDLNGDGHPDLLTQYNGGDLYVYPGSGHIGTTNTFWSGTDIGSWAGHDHLVLGDLNGDGHADLLTQYNGNDLYVYPGAGSISGPATFRAGTDIGSWAGHVDFALGDLNRDGVDDLVSMTAGGDLYVYAGEGRIAANGTFWSGKRLGSWVGHTNITL